MSLFGFAADMERLRTDPGVTRDRLDRMAAGILGIAATAPAGEVSEEAAELARTTLFSYRTWLAALEHIDGHPQRAALLGTLCDATSKLGANPHAMVLDLLHALGSDGIICAHGERHG